MSRSMHLIGSNDVLTKASILLRGLTRRCVSGQSTQAPRKHMEKNRTAAAYRLKIHQQDVPYEGDNQQECAETQPGEKKSSLVKRWKSERWQTDGKSFFFFLNVSRILKRLNLHFVNKTPSKKRVKRIRVQPNYSAAATALFHIISIHIELKCLHK